MWEPICPIPGATRATKRSCEEKSAFLRITSFGQSLGCRKIIRSFG